MTVRAQHRVAGVAVDREKREKDDFYPTPPEGTRALLTVEQFDGAIWEPACGDGAISKELAAAGYEVVSTDLVDRGYGEARVDFLLEWHSRAPNLVTNPPNKLLDQFMQQATRLVPGKIALLAPVRSVAGVRRRQIYETTALARIWVFAPRPQLWRGGVPTSENGSVMDLAWLVWDRAHRGPPTIGWIPR